MNYIGQTKSNEHVIAEVIDQTFSKRKFAKNIVLKITYKVVVNVVTGEEETKTRETRVTENEWQLGMIRVYGNEPEVLS